MAINRYTRRQALPIKFYTPPLDVMAKALQMKQTAYDKYYAIADQLAQQQISALAPDRARANAIIQGYQNSIDNVVEQYGGDYSRIGKDLQSLARQIHRDFTQGGEAFAIQSNYSQYQDWLKRMQDLIKAKVIRPEQLNMGSNYILSNYKGIGQIDPLTKTYNTINTVEIVPYVDISKKAMDAASKIVAEKGGYESWTLSNDGYIWGKKGSKWERVTPERITSVISNAINNDPAIAAYVQQSRMFGYDPLTQENLKGIIQQGIDTYAYNNTWSTSDIKFDPIGTKQIQDQMDAMQSQRYMPTINNPSGTPDMSKFSTGELGLGWPGGVFSWGPRIMMKALTGSDGSAVKKSGTLGEIVNRETFQNKYGKFSKILYDQMEKAGRFNGMSDAEKRAAYRKEYNKIQEEYHRQPLVYNFGDKTIKRASSEIGSSLGSMTFDYVDASGNLHSGITYKDLVRLSKGKTFNPSHKEMQEFQANMLKADGSGPRITGVTQSADGVSPGYILEGPGMNGYAIVRGYNADWDNQSKPLLDWSKPFQSPEPHESGWHVLPNSSIEVKTVGSPQFDENGKYIGNTAEFRVRPIGDNSDGVVDPGMTLEQLQQWVTENSNIRYEQHKSANTIMH